MQIDLSGEVRCTADDVRPVRVRLLPGVGAVWITAPAAGDEPRVSLRLDRDAARAMRDLLSTFLGG